MPLVGAGELAPADPELPAVGELPPLPPELLHAARTVLRPIIVVIAFRTANFFVPSGPPEMSRGLLGTKHCVPLFVKASAWCKARLGARAAPASAQMGWPAPSIECNASRSGMTHDQ